MSIYRYKQWVLPNDHFGTEIAKCITQRYNAAQLTLIKVQTHWTLIFKGSLIAKKIPIQHIGLPG